MSVFRHIDKKDEMEWKKETAIMVNSMWLTAWHCYFLGWQILNCSGPFGHRSERAQECLQKWTQDNLQYNIKQICGTYHRYRNRQTAKNMYAHMHGMIMNDLSFSLEHKARNIITEKNTFFFCFTIKRQIIWQKIISSLQSSAQNANKMIVE